MQTGTATTAQVREELRSFFAELVEEVQERYAVEVQDVEITEDNFGSVDAIVAFVDRKRAS
jgi:acyl carrier protein